MSKSPKPYRWRVGTLVHKSSGDYSYEGTIVARFRKLDGKMARYVVQNTDGLLHIFNGEQLSWGPRQP